jgi:hypothetical protein
MGRDKWDRIHNRNFLGDIHEEIEAVTAADKAYEQLALVAVPHLPACPMQDAIREGSRIVLKDFELRTDATLRRVMALSE